MSKPGRLALLLCCGVALPAMASAPVMAQTSRFNIPPQSLASALDDFSAETHIPVVATGGVIGNKVSPGVVGTIDAPTALARLLKGTGLTFRQSGRTYLVETLNSPAHPVAKVSIETKPPPVQDLELSATSQDDLVPQEVVVTGSRISRNGNNSPTPVTVVSTTELMQSTPSTVPDALNKLPVFSGSRSQATFNNGASNAVGNYLSLRDLSPQRTLVLFDGHRVGFTTQDGQVDANTIPQMLLQRIDVVAGGASAVYGSDAVSGVVNFVVDRKFSGLKGVVQGGLSALHDFASERAGIAWGTELFDGRGHFEGSLEYYNSDGIPSKLSRQSGRDVYSEQGAGTAANPYHLISGTRLATTSFSGLIDATSSGNPFAGYVFNNDGTLRPFVHGTPSGTTGIESGGDGAFYDKVSLEASLRSSQAFGRFDYALTDSVAAYAQLSATQSYNGYNWQNSELRSYTVSTSNAFLLPQYQAAMQTAGQSTFTFSRLFDDTSPMVVDATVRNLFFVAGLDGTIASGAHWDAAYSRTDTSQYVITRNNLNLGHVAAALDAVVDPSTHKIVCNVTLTNPGLYPGCVPLDLFGQNTITPAMAGYIFGSTSYNLENTQDDLTASVSGAFLDTWAGPVQMALSGEYRHLTLNVTSGVQPLDRLNCTGLRFNCSSSTPLYQGNVVADETGLAQNVSEVAYEVDVPLLKKVYLADALNVNGAIRYTDYDTSGAATTWKLGVDWHPSVEWSVRAARSQDIRAPDLNDLYAPININPVGFSDLHTGGLTGIVNVLSRGNPNLKPEVAHTTTIGAVYRPGWMPLFSLAVDAYDIEIDGAITSVSGQLPAVQKLCDDSNGTNAICGLILRPLPFSDRSAANFPVGAISEPFNVATVISKGVDFEANYALALWGGNMSVRGLATYVSELTTVDYPGAEPSYQAGAAANNNGGLPNWKGSVFVHYDRQQVSVDLQERWFSFTRQNSTHSFVFSDPRYPAAAYTDLTVTYALKRNGRDTQFFLTANNLFNRKLDPYQQAGGGSTRPGLFITSANGEDAVGFYVTAGVRFKM